MLEGSGNPPIPAQPDKTESQPITPNTPDKEKIKRFRALAPKCLAKRKHGGLCQNIPVTGRKRCRMHGGTNYGPRSIEGKARAWLNLKPFRNGVPDSIMDALIARNQPPAESAESEPITKNPPSTPQGIVDAPSIIGGNQPKTRK